MIPLKDDNPTRTVPFVTAGLIAANLFVFAYLFFMGGEGAQAVLVKFAAVPSRMFAAGGGMTFDGALLTPVSSMFLHGSLLHVGGNMLFLWIFGDNVEDALGHAGFIAFYLACGLAGAYAHALTDVSSDIPMIGASGAVSGVLGAYMLMYPRARVWTFFFFLFFWQVVRVPAVIIIGMWVLLQLLYGVTDSGMAGGVAWFAHLGGFAAGVVIIILAGRRPGRRRKR